MHTAWKSKLREVSSFFIVANSISWFMLTLIFIVKILNSQSLESIALISSTYFGGLILASVIGGTILKRSLLKKNNLLLWNLTGVLSCFLLFFFYSQADLFSITILSLVLSSSAGLGIPACLALFSSQTKNENRGRLGAVIFFLIQLLTALILFPLTDEISNFNFFVLSIWRFIGVLGLLYYIPPEMPVDDHKTSLSFILRERRFILLFLPWFMLTLINFIEIPVVEQSMGPTIYGNYIIVNSVVSSIAAIPGGILCDLKGRKITGILGFIFLGLGYALLSMFSISNKAIAYASFTIFDGIAWGLLYVTFIFVVWGDLAEGHNIEKYYVLGGLPFLLSGLIQVLVQPLVPYIDVGMSFTLASFFLFLALLPLLYAPESLSEKIMKDRELSSYIQKALTSANKKKEEEPLHDKEARELAEKYY
jgi:MFS family permease